MSLLCGELCGAARGGQARADEPVDVMTTTDVLDWIWKWSGALPYPSQFGPPGWPGKDPELVGEYGYRGNNWGWPEVIPYPGSVEHVRVHRQRYMPMYPACNARTLVRNFRVTELPGIGADRIVDYAEPVYRVPKYRYANPAEGVFSDAIKLGKYRDPVKVVRFDQHNPPMEVDLGALMPGAYAFRMIAATDSERVQQSTKRLVIHFEVNDGPNGEVNAYMKRCAAIDQFYSMAEFFFMAPAERQYKAKVWVDATSELPLYVYNLDLHDRLGQVANRAGKKTASLYDEKEREARWDQLKGGRKPDTRSQKERFEADAALWQMLPPMNAQMRGDGRFWTETVESVFRLPPDKKDDGMGIDVYGSDMIWNVPQKEYGGHRYEWLYRGASLAGRYWRLQRQTYYGKAAEINLQMRRVRDARALAQDAGRYDQSADEQAARRAAIRLAMMAWANIFNYDGARQQMVAIDCIPEIAWNQGDMAFRRRRASHYGELENVQEYDRVFPYIRDNKDLAESLGRFIPWIKTPQDMRRFYDVGLLQLPAYETMIYQRTNGYSQGPWLTWYIAVQQDPEITRPWLQYLFRYVWTYPRMPTGIDENLFQSWTRDGASTIGSTFYAHAYITALRDTLRNLSLYGEEGKRALPERLQIPDLFTRAKWEGRFSSDMMVAGGYRFCIGDVSGPSRQRWVVSGNPETDLRVDAHNRSRVLSNWCGVLETNVEDDNFRNRRAAGVRVGNGVGHAHDDPLDLQIWSLGVPLCGDWGARGGYCYPSSKGITAHNTVVAPKLLANMRHRWIASFSDTKGARYLMGQVKCPGLYGRQIALVDFDDPAPNSYVVDIFRVKDDQEKPYYAFHGPPPDEFYTNIAEVKPGYPDGDEGPLFDPAHNWHGAIPSRLTASWRMSRDDAEVEWTPSAKMQKSLTWFGLPGEGPEGKQVMRVPGAEKKAMGSDFDATSPRKSIRMHLVGHDGAVAFGRRGYGVRAEKFYNDMLFVYPARWQGQTVFPVVFEPCADERAVRNVALLTGQASVDNASAPITLEVTLRNGRRDVIYTALRDAPAFDIPGHGKVQAEYAFLSYDQKGLRQATLVGGILLATADVTIKTAMPAYTGTVVAANASERSLTLSNPLPLDSVDAVIETGPDQRRTSYTIESVDGNRIVMYKDFALAMTRIKGFMPDGNPYTNTTVYAEPGVPVSNEKGDIWWTLGKSPYELTDEEKPWPAGGSAHPAEVPPKGRALNLLNGPKPSEVMHAGERIWVRELGVGNTYRLPIHVNIIRRVDGTYEVQRNIAAEITVGGKPLPEPPKE